MLKNDATAVYVVYTREQNNAAIIYDLIATSESTFIMRFLTFARLTVGIHTMLN